MIIISKSMREFKIQIILVLFLFLTLQLGSCASKSTLPSGETPVIEPPVDGIRIGWDFRSLTRIAPLDSRTGYFGYARMVQLYDGRLACVYETSSGNIELVFSADLGQTWGSLQVIFETKNNIAQADNAHKAGCH